MKLWDDCPSIHRVIMVSSAFSRFSPKLFGQWTLNLLHAPRWWWPEATDFQVTILTSTITGQKGHLSLLNLEFLTFPPKTIWTWNLAHMSLPRWGHETYIFLGVNLGFWGHWSQKRHQWFLNILPNYLFNALWSLYMSPPRWETGSYCFSFSHLGFQGQCGLKTSLVMPGSIIILHSLVHFPCI